MQLIYQTDKTPLAVTLATCGVPFDADPRTGQPMPFVHYYSAEILLSLGYRGSGMTVDDAAYDAWKKGRCGQLVYSFQRTDLLDEILRAFDRHSGAMALADQGAGGHGSQVLGILSIPVDVAVQLCCQFAKNRNVMMGGWKKSIPWIHLPGDVETITEGGVTYRVGSMKLYQLGASAATKAKIGL